MRHALTLLSLVVGISFLPLNTHAQWQPDGVPLCTAAVGQYGPAIVSDGAGGAIVAWEDQRSGDFDIYAQRVDAAGVPQWPANGLALCTAANWQDYPKIASDGAGGAIVTWQDIRNDGFTIEIYAQRVDASGIPQWTADGVALSTAGSAPMIISDGAGGAIVVWYSGYTIYVQRVDANGAAQWTANGVALSADVDIQDFPAIESDSAGGAIVSWGSTRNGNNDIYAQRVNASGVAQWTANGIALCIAVNGQYSPKIISDGVGGAIVAWRDYRSGTNFDLYAQRVNASGVPQWTADGIGVSTAVKSQVDHTIAVDGAGGAIVTWEDGRSGTSSQIFTQRVNASGVPQWTADGVALSQVFYQQNPNIVSDDAGGVIVSWEDPGSLVGFDIYAQRVNASGVPQWIADGVAVCTALNDQRYPRIVSDGVGGAIVTWQDGRNRSGAPTDLNEDIFAQNVTDPSNAVAIASFDASETNGVVTLRSAFRSDLGVEAVNVYRAIGTDRDPLLVIERVSDVLGDRFKYVDRDVAPGQSYRYQIGVVDADGEFFSPIVTVSVGAITAELSQNQPNPFNPTTTIRFVLPVREQVTLAIYDASGRLVRTLVNEVEGYGAHEVTWDGRNHDGATMGSGVYFYRLHAGKRTESKKMILLK